jgi:hypothetical protein
MQPQGPLRAAAEVVAEEGGVAEEGEVAELLLRVKLDDLEVDAADALLPPSHLVFTDLANGVGLLPAPACSLLRLRDGHHLRHDGILLLVIVDVVTRGERWLIK